MTDHNPDSFGIEQHLRWTAADDSIHPVGNAALDWTESIWFSFNVPQRSIGGWLYVQMRPNLGTVSGGAFVYDPSSALPWELPWFGYQHHQRLPEPLDITDVTFPTGVSVKVIEPGMVYDLKYQFRDQTDFTADLRFEGLTPPVPHRNGAPPFVGSSHYDQHGRVTGTLHLRGEDIPVDCIAVRDRSWGRRPERLGRVERLSYAFGHLDRVDGTQDAFLAFCVPHDGDAQSLTERVVSGYLFRDGVLRRFVSGERRTTRDPVSGGPATIELDCVDEDDRRLVVRGVAESRMFLSIFHLCINTILRWEDVSGEQPAVGYGEDQDVWALADFADRIQADRIQADRVQRTSV